MFDGEDPQADAGAPSAPIARASSVLTLAIPAGTALLLLDAIGLTLAWPLALLLAVRTAPAWWWAVAVPLYPAAIVAANYAVGLYRREAGLSLRRALVRVPVAALMGAVAASAVLLLLRSSPPPPGLLAAAVASAVGVAARGTFDLLRRQGILCRRLLILGAGRRAWDLAWLLHKEGRTPGYRLQFVHDPQLGPLDPRLAAGTFGPVETLGAGGIQAVVNTMLPDEVVVAPDDRRGMDVQGLLECKIGGFPVSDFLGFLEREVRRVDIKRIEFGWLLYSDGFTIGLLDRGLKRLLDVSLSLLVLLVMSPILLTCMALIRWQDNGPALYRQARVTKHGRIFHIMKLRTMRTDAEAGGATWAAQGDSRVTRLGAFLRRARLDEVPQLVNVLRGEMSFVGPRPERPEFVEMLASHLPLYRERHAVKAGLTGWAQVNYPYGASVDDARSKLSYDLYYVKNFSILLDVLIVLQTIRVVLWPSGVR